MKPENEKERTVDMGTNGLKRNSKMKNKSIYLGYFILLLSLVPLFIIALYSRPCVDDFSYSIYNYKLITNGECNIFKLLLSSIKTDISFYKNWQGLYSSAFLLSLQPGIFGEKLYFIGSWILLLLGLFSTSYFVHTFLKLFGIVGSETRIIGLFLFVFLIQQLPSAVQGIYWFNGAWNYTFFFWLCLINFSLIVRYIHTGSAVYIVSSCFISFVISGGNHVTGFLNILVLLVLAFSFRYKKFIFASLLVSIIGYILVFIAPGTLIRQMTLEKQGVITTLLHSLVGCVMHLNDWMTLQWIMFIVLMVFLSFYIIKFHKINVEMFKIKPVILFIICFIIMCGLFCVPYMAGGSFGDLRLQNVIWLYFVIVSGMLTIYSILYLYVNGVLNINSLNLNIYRYVLIVVAFLICIFCYSNSYFALYELIDGTADKYAKNFDARLQLMNEISDNHTIEVNQLPNSKILKFDDISFIRDDWRNATWNDYYSTSMVVQINFDNYIKELQEEDSKRALIFIMRPDVIENGTLDVLHSEDINSDVNLIVWDNNEIYCYDDALTSGMSMNIPIGEYAFYASDDKYVIYIDGKEFLKGSIYELSNKAVEIILLDDELNKIKTTTWQQVY